MSEDEMRMAMIEIVDRAMVRCKRSAEVTSFLPAFIIEYELWLDNNKTFAYSYLKKIYK
jgi:hypothetical protein